MPAETGWKQSHLLTFRKLQKC